MHLNCCSDDPEEKYNLAKIMPEMTQMLKERIDRFLPYVARAMFPSPHRNWSPDNYGGVYSPGWCTLEELKATREKSLSYATLPMAKPYRPLSSEIDQIDLNWDMFQKRQKSGGISITSYDGTRQVETSNSFHPILISENLWI